MSLSASRQWHEAAYILSIKEKHILAQATVDEILATTKLFISDILSDLMKNIRGNTPVDTMCMIENEVQCINDSIFKGISTEFLQKEYFKRHFDLVVSRCKIRVLY